MKTTYPVAIAMQVQLAHPPVQMRAHEPPSQPTEMWAGGCEIDFVVNLERFARPVVCHFVFQARGRIALSRPLEFTNYGQIYSASAGSI